MGRGERADHDRWGDAGSPTRAATHSVPRRSWHPVALALALLCTFGPALAGTPATLQVSQVTAQGTDLVAYVRVQDESGAPVPGITQPQVHATVGAETAQVTDFQPFAETGEGVTTLFLVDASQSIAGPRFEQLRAALRAWVDALGPKDRAGIIAFGSEVRTLVAPTADPAALKTAIAALTNRDPQTRLHGALLQALNLAHRQEPGLPDRRAIVLFSDGLADAPGDLKAEEVLARLADGAVPIYAVGFLNPRDKARQAAGLDALGQFARRSGGTAVTAPAGDPGPPLARLRADIQAVYRAALACPGCTADGNRYRVQIGLTSAGLTLADGMDLRLYPVVAPPPAAAKAEPTPAPAPVPEEPAPPAARAPRWVYLAAAAAGALLLLVPAVVWFLRRFLRRRAVAATADAAVPPPPEPAPVTVAATQPPERAGSGPPISLSFRTGPRRGETIRLTAAPAILLGRDPSCTLVLSDDDRVSGRHAWIRAEGRVILIEDLDSTNGTALNGVAVQAPSPLADGDLIRLGGTELRVGLPKGAVGAGAR